MLLFIVHSVEKKLGRDVHENRNSRLEVFCKKVFLKIWQSSQENTCGRKVYSFIKNKNLAQVFSCEGFKNTYFYRTPLLAASVRN